MKKNHKVMTAVGLAGVSVAAVVIGLPIYAESSFDEHFVKPMEKIGFAVAHEPISLGGGGAFLSAGTKLVRMERGPVTLVFEDVAFKSSAVSFDSSQLSNSDYPVPLVSGPGKIGYEKGKSFSVEMLDVVVNGQMAEPIPALKGGETFDFTLSGLEKTDGFHSELVVSFNESGALTVSSVLKGIDIWGAESPDHIVQQLNDSRLVAARIQFDNNGGFEELTKSFAVDNGIEESEVNDYLKIGFAGSIMPNPYRATVVKFIDSPGVISGQIAPVDEAGEPLLVSELKRNVDRMIAGYVSTTELLTAMNFQLTSLPK